MSGRPEPLWPLFADLTGLDGIGPKSAQALEATGIETPRDLLFTLPYSGIDRHLKDSVIAAELPGVVSVVHLFFLKRQVERLGRRRGQQPVRVVERAQERFLLIVATGKADRALANEFFERLVAVGKARLAHAGRRPNGVQRVIRIGDVERPVLAAKEAGRVERLKFLALANIEPLADVDERRHRRVARPKRAGDHRADVRGGDRLRRRVAGVPLGLP